MSNPQRKEEFSRKLVLCYIYYCQVVNDCTQAIKSVFLILLGLPVDQCTWWSRVSSCEFNQSCFNGQLSSVVVFVSCIYTYYYRWFN